MNAYEVIDIIADYLLGKDYYIVDPVGGDQAAVIIAHDILRRHSRKYRKEGRNLIDEDFIKSKTATVILHCSDCDTIIERSVVLDNDIYDKDFRYIVETLVYRYNYSLCPRCDKRGVNFPMKVIGVKYRGHYKATNVTRKEIPHGKD